MSDEPEIAQDDVPETAPVLEAAPETVTEPVAEIAETDPIAAVPQPVAAARVEPPEPEAPPPKQGESWLETVKTIVYALLIALVIRTFLFQPFNIPSGSMEATLLVGDYLFAKKFAYGYSRNSFPYSSPPFSGRVFGTAPTRGDV